MSLVVVMTCVGCIAADSQAPRPVYDALTRVLVRLDWDSNGDGRIDHRTYVHRTVPYRTEIDRDDDGRVDTWEYVAADGKVRRLGTASANDGVEDTWTWPADGAGTLRIDRAQYRDGVADRAEYFQRDVLVRAEEDANRDGRIDKWETWEGGVLRAAAYDTSFAAGRADRRVLYDDAGRFAYMEADSDGDGRFERMTAAEAATTREVNRE